MCIYIYMYICICTYKYSKYSSFHLILYIRWENTHMGKTSWLICMALWLQSRIQRGVFCQNLGISHVFQFWRATKQRFLQKTRIHLIPQKNTRIFQDLSNTQCKSEIYCQGRQMAAVQTFVSSLSMHSELVCKGYPEYFCISCSCIIWKKMQNISIISSKIVILKTRQNYPRPKIQIRFHSAILPNNVFKCPWGIEQIYRTTTFAGYWIVMSAC